MTDKVFFHVLVPAGTSQTTLKFKLSLGCEFASLFALIPHRDEDASFVWVSSDGKAVELRPSRTPMDYGMASGESNVVTIELRSRSATPPVPAPSNEEMAALSAKLEAAERKATEAQRAHNKAAEELLALRDVQRARSTQLDSKSAELATVTAELKVLQERLADQRREMLVVDEKNDELQHELNAVQDMFQTQRDDNEQREAKDQATIVRCENLIRTLEAKLKGAQTTAEEEANRCRQLESENKALEREAKRAADALKQQTRLLQYTAQQLHSAQCAVAQSSRTPVRPEQHTPTELELSLLECNEVIVQLQRENTAMRRAMVGKGP